MLKIEYEIQINESGRPCVELSPENTKRVEDKFFVLELTRYLIQYSLMRRTSEIDQLTLKKINETLIILEQISDEVAISLYEDMKIKGDVQSKMDSTYHIVFENIEERNLMKDKNHYYDGALYDRFEGLKVLVADKMKIYELGVGLTNDDWREL